MSPVEGIHNVTLTCLPQTTYNVTSYVFYKNNVVISNTTNSNYSLPNNSRSDDGNYTCGYATTKAPTSPKADQVAVNFLCKLLKNRISEFQICFNTTGISFLIKDHDFLIFN